MHKRGFTIFFAVLVSSLALAVGLAIYDLLSRELILSQTATQSQYAIYAADTGAECALYWDNKYVGPDGLTSAFATSTDSDPPASGVFCTLQNNGSSQDIALYGTPGGTFGPPPGSGSTAWSSWCWDDARCQAPTANAATTTFYIVLGTSASSPCAKVEVAKVGDPSQTTVISHGYNTCASTGVVRLERALQVNY